MRRKIQVPGFTPEQLEQLIKILPTLPEEQQAELAKLTEQVTVAEHRRRCRDDFLYFVKYMWPEFIEGPHHKAMADCFERMAKNKLSRAAISMAPRSGKSRLTSVFFPAWYLGKFPSHKVLQVSHKSDLAVGFGRDVRNIFSDPRFKDIFPDVSLRADSKAAGRWETNKGGTYYAAGVGAGLSGFGSDICLLDDVHADTDAPAAIYDPSIFDKVYQWYTAGPRQRLQPKGKIAVISTRWGQRDIIGRLLEDEKTKGADKWEVLNFPAIKEDGTSYWPEFWSIDELLATKSAVIAGGSSWLWNAAYMQNPTAEEGALIKNEWWNHWPDDFEKKYGRKTRQENPKCHFTIQAWDTAFRTTQRSNYSVCTTWGVWYDDEDTPQVIMLDCWRDKVEFPELKRIALELYRKWEPDSCIIERKANGEALISELRRIGVYAEDFTPTRGDGDKIARVNAVTDIFASGVVWIKEAAWTSDVLEESQAFPLGANDDIVDTISLALYRYRKGNFIKLSSDEYEDEGFSPFAKADYY